MLFYVFNSFFIIRKSLSSSYSTIREYQPGCTFWSMPDNFSQASRKIEFHPAVLDSVASLINVAVAHWIF